MFELPRGDKVVSLKSLDPMYAGVGCDDIEILPANRTVILILYVILNVSLYEMSKNADPAPTAVMSRAA